MADWVDDFGNKLTNVHESNSCATQSSCTIHSPSSHSMIGLPQKWRDDRGFMERICVHGVGHPDPDETLDDERLLGTHGCDGCCVNEIP